MTKTTSNAKTATTAKKVVKKWLNIQNVNKNEKRLTETTTRKFKPAPLSG